MKALRPALVALVFCAPLLASGQWLWMDKDGKKVYSDRPPPSDIAPDRILKQPGARGKSVDTAPAAAAATTAAAPAAAQPPVGKDKALEDKRKLAASAEADKKKAEEAKVAAIQADNCARAKTAKNGFDAGYRVAQTNAKGEREIMDDNQRAVEVKRLEAVIARDCR
ncbi:DUF4124 domain-containing protein [Ramlibacter sp. PS3R-8]|uniref:DUF4124 domain-containing protein n=1 Tax=Ramlibacter sp. PS3R-8 TaxID=3133437 RepID=UPI0030B0F4BE